MACAAILLIDTNVLLDLSVDVQFKRLVAMIEIITGQPAVFSFFDDDVLTADLPVIIVLFSRCAFADELSQRGRGDTTL